MNLHRLINRWKIGIKRDDLEQKCGASPWTLEGKDILEGKSPFAPGSETVPGAIEKTVALVSSVNR